MENDRVLGDLWGKSNVPVVLNNPYSEAEQVSARRLCCVGWGWVAGCGPLLGGSHTAERLQGLLGCPGDPRSQDLESMVHRAHVVQKLNSPGLRQGTYYWRRMLLIQGAKVEWEHSQGPHLQNLPWDHRPFWWQKAEPSR